MAAVAVPVAVRAPAPRALMVVELKTGVHIDQPLWAKCGWRLLKMPLGPMKAGIIRPPIDFENRRVFPADGAAGVDVAFGMTMPSVTATEPIATPSDRWTARPVSCRPNSS